MTNKELCTYLKCPECKSLLKEVGITQVYSGGWSEFRVSANSRGSLEYEHQATDDWIRSEFRCNKCRKELYELDDLDEHELARVLR